MIGMSNWSRVFVWWDREAKMVSDSTSQGGVVRPMGRIPYPRDKTPWTGDVSSCFISHALKPKIANLSLAWWTAVAMSQLRIRLPSYMSCMYLRKAIFYMFALQCYHVCKAFRNVCQIYTIERATVWQIAPFPAMYTYLHAASDTHTATAEEWTL